MQSDSRVASVSKTGLWLGRALSGLAILFLLADGIGHLMMPAPVKEAFAKLGVPINLSIGIGIVALVCTVLYAIPRTSTLGAILLTGYLGGAVSIQARAGSPLFETIFPIILGALIWAGIYLRNDRLRSLIPLQSPRDPM
jgi:DoxX-like family